MTGKRKVIAVVEDEKDIRELISIHLTKEGFQVADFCDASGFFSFLKKKNPDLVLLDLMLPDTDGLDICRKLRLDQSTRQIPVIMLTAKTAESDKVAGLEIGADDYVTKPFSPRELIARIRSVLRRYERDPQEEQVLNIDPQMSIDVNRHQVSIKGKPVELTFTEFRILELLASNPGWVFPREEILEHLWGEDRFVTSRTVDVHIRHLREKLGKKGSLIRNVRGVGYKLL